MRNNKTEEISDDGCREILGVQIGDTELILQAPDMTEARRRLKAFIEEFESKVPKAVNCLEGAFEDAMAVMVLPDKYRKRLRTTNMQERLNEEIRRRERVIRIFPDWLAEKDTGKSNVLELNQLTN